MNLLYFGLSVLAIIPIFLIWVSIHEYSHLLMAKWLVGVSEYKIWLLPHKMNGNFYFGRVVFIPKKELTDRQEVLVLMAPRIMGLVALILFPLIGLHVPPIVCLLLLGGLIDWFHGFMGGNKETDIDRTAKLLNIDIGWLRFIGFSMAIISFSIFFLQAY